jgi:hypothetical protein
VTQRTEDGYTRESTFTNAQGETATRSAVVVNDPESGTRTRDVTYTGVDGETRTVHDVAQRSDAGYTRDSTYTNTQGQSATRNAVVANDREAGTRSRDVTYTGVNGQVTTANTVTTRTDTGYVSETTVTAPNGESATRSATVSCERVAGKCTKDVQIDAP